MSFHFALLSCLRFHRLPIGFSDIGEIIRNEEGSEPSRGHLTKNTLVMDIIYYADDAEESLYDIVFVEHGGGRKY